MDCNIKRPDPQDNFDKHLQMFQNTVLGGAEVIPESNEWYAVSVNVAVSETFFALTNQALNRRDPRKNCCEDLIALAAEQGIYPIDAIPAQGFIKINGFANTPLPSTIEFDVDGSQFVTASSDFQPFELNDEGQAVLRVVALVPGELGNLSNATAIITSAVPGVQVEAEVCGGTFCGGSDPEECEAFRRRFLQLQRYTPRATEDWIKNKFLEWPCVTRSIARQGVCCSCEADDSCESCGGGLSFYVMFDNSFDHGIPDPSVLAEVEEWMFGSPQGFGNGQVEMGICGRVVPVTAVPVNATVSVTGCVTASQISLVDSIVREYFSVVEPSTAVVSSDIEISILRALGDIEDVSVRVNLELDDVSQGYGTVGPKTESSVVYTDQCSLEADCDYLLVLNNLVQVRSANNAEGC